MLIVLKCLASGRSITGLGRSIGWRGRGVLRLLVSHVVVVPVVLAVSLVSVVPLQLKYKIVPVLWWMILSLTLALKV